eukprot:SAG11_NODE_5174_length_1640_cov_1.878001_1_plen_65_part_10
MAAAAAADRRGATVRGTAGSSSVLARGRLVAEACGAHRQEQPTPETPRSSHRLPPRGFAARLRQA